MAESRGIIESAKVLEAKERRETEIDVAQKLLRIIKDREGELKLLYKY